MAIKKPFHQQTEGSQDGEDPHTKGSLDGWLLISEKGKRCSSAENISAGETDDLFEWNASDCEEGYHSVEPKISAPASPTSGCAELSYNSDGVCQPSLVFDQWLPTLSDPNDLSVSSSDRTTLEYTDLAGLSCWVPRAFPEYWIRAGDVSILSERLEALDEEAALFEIYQGCVSSSDRAWQQQQQSFRSTRRHLEETRQLAMHDAAVLRARCLAHGIDPDHWRRDKNPKLSGTSAEETGYLTTVSVAEDLADIRKILNDYAKAVRAELVTSLQ